MLKHPALAKRSTHTIALALLLFLTARVDANAVLTDDASITAGKATNSGKRTSLALDASQSALLKFSIDSALPAAAKGRDISKATLRVFIGDVKAPGELSALPITASWDEGTVSGITAPALGAVITPPSPVTVAMKNKWLEFNVTSLVQDWVDGTTANYGIAIHTDQAKLVLNSKENTATGHEPNLEIVLGSAHAYSIGDVGPSGVGKVFYVTDGGFHGMEAATSDQNTGVVSWGACGATAISGADGTAIGTGQQNSADITVGCVVANTAAAVAQAYRGGGKIDWFLPSKDELNELYNQKNSVGGFGSHYYWSSTEEDTNNAWFQSFLNGYSGLSSKGNTGVYVRAIRAF